MSPRLHVRSLRPVVAATGSLALAAGLCLTAAGPASAVQTEWAFDSPGHSTRYDTDAENRENKTDELH